MSLKIREAITEELEACKKNSERIQISRNGFPLIDVQLTEEEIDYLLAVIRNPRNN